MTHPIRRREACLSLLAAGLSSRTAFAQSETPLEIGVLPNISARLLLAQYQPMRDYLSRELQRPVQVSTAPNWNAFHQRTLGLSYDVVVTAANLARLAQVDRGFVPLVSYAPAIKGMVVSASRAPLKAVTDLRGQTLVLSNPQSLVTMRGMQWLAENGLQRDKDFKTINTPTDDSVGNVVLRGDAAAAMLSGGEFRAIPDAVRAQLTTLTVFAEVAGFVLLASPKLPAADVKALKDRLLNFAGGSQEGKAFFAASGFSSMRETAPGLMESMDAFVDTTRKVMAGPA